MQRYAIGNTFLNMLTWDVAEQLKGKIEQCQNRGKKLPTTT